MAEEIRAKLKDFDVLITPDDENGGHMVGVRNHGDSEGEWIWAKPGGWTAFGEYEMSDLASKVRLGTK